MFNDIYIYDFIKSLGITMGGQNCSVSSYTAEDALVLKSHLSRPLEANPTDNHNIQLESLVTLVRSLVNLRNMDGKYLAECYLQATHILTRIKPQIAEKEPEYYLSIHNGDLLYEISKLLESPLNVISARLYGVHPADYMQHENSTTHEESRCAA